ncbi:potassium voltage-gated channel protein Shaw-like [Littorina saxatilis]|uniref:Uncharacterized protein n=1 Tax=Littorina saxatilis TaxID=31220 RepID=A0AAN9AV92_9CAEN
MKRGPKRKSCITAMKPYLITGNRKNIPPSYQAAQPNFRNFVRINVNGRVFDLSRSTCIRIPVLQGMLTRGSKTSLGERKKGDTDGPADEVYFERNPSVFAAVVDYVQNNELHVPTKVCPKLFARDLNFWGFDIDEVEPCCFSRVVHFLWEQEKLAKFHDFLRSSPEEQPKGRRKSKFETMRSRVWKVLDEPFTSIPARIYFYAMCVFIVTSFFTIAAGTMEMFHKHEHKHQAVHNMHMISYTCNAYLYLDYLLRFLFCPSLRSFFMDLINVTDGLAVLSSIAKTIVEEMILVTDHTNKFYLEAIDILQLLRILRLVRPMSKVTGFRLIYFTLKCSFQELLLVFMLLGFLTIFFSTTLYYVDDGVCIESIPHGMWFALTTMTTVGYGDIVPKKAGTKVVGSVMAVFGIIMMSMTMPIMVSNFNALYINAVVGQPTAIEKAHEQIGNTGSTESDAENGLEEAAEGETSGLEAAKERCAKCCLSLRACLSRACKVACPPAEKSKSASDAEEERRTFSGDEADDESDSGNSSADDIEEYFINRWNRSPKVSPCPGVPVYHDRSSKETVATRRLLLSKVCDTACEEYKAVGLSRRRFAVISDGVSLLHEHSKGDDSNHGTFDQE